ncbi:hypothetical protein EUGRSUZ_F03826 [Eucalyptus grandis]|uniref:Uncharacterized protein n=2 Tax=Eucalyptus grandis TaxID=71139 RepID=A0ACC3KMN9_EUCGR|nr:hypothetical protein EUGRSUZ_F03826 [Eucalyptus grandis]
MVRACSSVDGKSKVYRELRLFSLKRKIEDAVQRTEKMAPTALQIEEAKWIKLDGLIRDYDLWDDPAKSYDVLVKLADMARAVDALRDLTYKAEEAKLITQLVEMDAINYALFEQAYTSSLDMSKFLDCYEMLKLLKGPYDVNGASMVIKAESNGNYHEKRRATNGGITSATVEFEFDYAYGCLQGERGVHRIISGSETGSTIDEVSLAAVDIIHLFRDSAPDLKISEEDLLILCPSSSPEVKVIEGWSGVVIQHVPTGFVVQSLGERSIFANKIKALNWLKAKLLIAARDVGVPSINGFKKENVFDVWRDKVRRYVLYPRKHVKDVRSGVEMPDLYSVLDGNIEPLIGAHIQMRLSNDMPP